MLFEPFLAKPLSYVSAASKHPRSSLALSLRSPACLHRTQHVSEAAANAARTTINQDPDLIKSSIEVAI